MESENLLEITSIKVCAVHVVAQVNDSIGVYAFNNRTVVSQKKVRGYVIIIIKYSVERLHNSIMRQTALAVKGLDNFDVISEMVSYCGRNSSIFDQLFSQFGDSAFDKRCAENDMNSSLDARKATNIAGPDQTPRIMGGV